MRTIITPNFTTKIDTKPFKDFNILQGYAHMEGVKDAILDGKDKFYIVSYVNNLPTYSWTAVSVGVNVLRIVTKLYGHPERRNHIPLRTRRDIIFTYIQMYDDPEFDYIKLKLVSRSPLMTPWNNLFKNLNYTVDDDTVYCIGNYKYSEVSWKNIYYKGDITALNRPKMSMQQFQLMFGSQT